MSAGRQDYPPIAGLSPDLRPNIAAFIQVLVGQSKTKYNITVEIEPFNIDSYAMYAGGHLLGDGVVLTDWIGEKLGRELNRLTWTSTTLYYLLPI